MLSVFITPWMKPTVHPLRHQRRLARTHGLEQGQRGALALRCRRVVPGDGVVGEPTQQVEVAGGAGVLEAAHAQVAAGHAGEHGAGQHDLPLHPASGRDDGQRPRRGDAEGVHRLADDVLAQHRADSGETVAAASERRTAGALEVQVAHLDRRRRPARRAAAPARRPVAGSTRRTGGRRTPARPAARPRGPRCRSGSARRCRCAGGPGPGRARQPARSLSTSRRGSGAVSACPLDRQLGQLAGEPVVEDQDGGRGGTHPVQRTRAV